MPNPKINDFSSIEELNRYFPNPDWYTWGLIPSASVEAVVALSCGIDPESVQRIPYKKMAWEMPAWFFDYLTPDESFDFDAEKPWEWSPQPFRAGMKIAEYRRRLKIVCSHIEEGLLLSSFIEGDHGLTQPVLKINDFMHWANRYGLSLPPKFPRNSFCVNQNPLPDHSDKWPWGEHHTKLLGHLAEAGEKFWKNYDPNDNTSAPTNKQVEEWIKKQGVSGRIAEAMASILRADGLPTGPRK